VSWSSVSDLKAQVTRLWERGELLRSLISRSADVALPASAGHDGATFPLRLVLKAPGSTELAERFPEVRTWIAQLRAIEFVRIDWREIQHRVLGAQQVPQAVWIDSLEDAFAFGGKRTEVARFRHVLGLALTRQPVLLEWLRRRPLQALELSGELERLLAVVEWIGRRPRPGVFLRQVDIAGVHSKFIERRLGVLSEWLDLMLPPGAIVAAKTGVGQFAARYGFLEKPVRIRFRLLDARLPSLPGVGMADITLDADSFAALKMPVRRVFITENETNFLAFPLMKEAIVVFGSGYGFDALARAEWIRLSSVYYWGDIDTHGFAILDQLRGHFPHVQSFLMDRATLIAHQPVWGEEDEPVLRDLPWLDDDERSLYDDLRDKRIKEGVRLRLEQEHVGFQWVRSTLASLKESP
jgi:hypothetical protein